MDVYIDDIVGLAVDADVNSSCLEGTALLAIDPTARPKQVDEPLPHEEMEA